MIDKLPLSDALATVGTLKALGYRVVVDRNSSGQYQPLSRDYRAQFAGLEG